MTVKYHVTLWVKDFAALTLFETQANAIMKEYDGTISMAFELERSGQQGVEIHILEFKSAEQFSNYRADKRLVGLSALREKAIEKITVQTISAEKTYT